MEEHDSLDVVVKEEHNKQNLMPTIHTCSMSDTTHKASPEEEVHHHETTIDNSLEVEKQQDAESSQRERRTRRKRPWLPIQNGRNKDLFSTPPIWESFRCQEHSLRISVSDVAACAGFHPYKDLVKLFMNYVYQGRAGQALLQQDAKVLDLQLITEEQALKDIAQKAGPATQQALQAALQVSTGARKVHDVVAAQKLQQTVQAAVQKTKNKLSKEEIQVLHEGARHSIHCGFGTSWESKALDMFEKQCGWEIDDRNAEVRTWPFDRNGRPIQPAYASSYHQSHHQQGINPSTDKTSTKTTCTESSLTKEETLSKCHEVTAKADEIIIVSTDDHEDSASGSDQEPKNPSLESKEKYRPNTAPKEGEEIVSVAKYEDDVTGIDQEMESPSPESHEKDVPDTIDLVSLDDDNNDHDYLNTNSKQQDPLPRLFYFCLRGSVDGIRNELVPSFPPPKMDDHNKKKNDDIDAAASDDDSWVLRRVIVECKHRMYQLMSSPPLYEMIQATAYCLMYQVEDADLLQVLRQPKKRSNTKPKARQSTKENSVAVNRSEPITESNHKIENFFTSKKNSWKDAKSEDSNQVIKESRQGGNNNHDDNQNTPKIRPGSPEKKPAVADPYTHSDCYKDVVGTGNDPKVKRKESKQTPDDSNPTNALEKEHDVINDDQKEKDGDDDGSEVDMKLSVHRISIHDPMLRHGENWKEMVIPHLVRWVKAVYSVRGDDGARYQLLRATATSTGEASKEAWDILFQHCPWLRDCDTAYRRC